MVRCSLACLAFLFLGGEAAIAQRLAFDPPTQREAVILRALAQSARFKFHQTPLHQVCDTIEKKHGILPMLDIKSLDEVGIGSDTPVTITIADVALQTALDLMLRSIDPTLTWCIEQEMLVITTREAAEERQQAWIYDVTALVNSDTYGPDFDALIEVITRTIEPDSWDEVGGPGSIAEYQTGGKDALVIAQTYAVHRKIDGFLRKLYRLAGQPVPSSGFDAADFSGDRWAARTHGIDNPRNLPMTRPRQSLQLRAAQSPRRFYSASQSPAVVIYAETK